MPSAYMSGSVTRLEQVKNLELFPAELIQSLFSESDPLAISLSNDGFGDFLSVNLSVIFGGILFAYEVFAFF